MDVSAGFIVRPVAGLTVGGSISTPNWMFLNEVWLESMNGNTVQYGYSKVDSPTGSYSYRVTSPFKWNLGVGYTVGNFLAIGVDYERTDYSDILLSSRSGNRDEFAADNELMASNFKAVNNIRAGIEAWPISCFAVRLGYNYYDTSEKHFDNSRHYASAGLGYRSTSGFFIDMAYQQQCNFNSNTFNLYDSYMDGMTAPVASEDYLNWKLVLTLGWRF